MPTKRNAVQFFPSRTLGNTAVSMCSYPPSTKMTPKSLEHANQLHYCTVGMCKLQRGKWKRYGEASVQNIRWATSTTSAR